MAWRMAPTAPKVLLAAPGISAHHDAGLYWLAALSRQGISTVVWDYRVEPQPPATDYSLALVLKGETVDPEILKRPRVVYWPDDPSRTPGIWEQLKKYDLVACPVPNLKDALWLPTSYDPLVHRPLPTMIKRSVVFCGTWTDRKQRFMQALMEAGLLLSRNLYGNGWEEVSAWIRPVYATEYVLVLSSASISVNVHRADIGVNRRLFESIACTFTLTDLVPGVREILGAELAEKVGFSTPEELVKKVEHYLSSPERDALWEQEKRAIAPYTYDAALGCILEKLSLT